MDWLQHNIACNVGNMAVQSLMQMPSAAHGMEVYHLLAEPTEPLGGRGGLAGRGFDMLQVLGGRCSLLQPGSCTPWLTSGSSPLVTPLHPKKR